MGAQYSLTCVNNSSLLGSFAVFQQPPLLPHPALAATAFPLVWLSRPADPGAQVTFQWTTDHSFVRAETGILQPGLIFEASQTVPADPLHGHVIHLTKDDDGATSFSAPAKTGSAGSLTIKHLSNVVPNRTTVGVGMSGAGTFVIQAVPDTTTVFQPQPNYWVVFGSYRTGQVMDIETITGEVEVTYGGPVTSHTVVLQPDNTLSVS